jgi:ubiquinone/menaquinone biosynthesis C-methylase UbiE
MYKKDGEILAEDGLAKINFGSYKDCFYFGWINIDILDMKSYADQFGFNFIQHDVTKPLLIKDGIVDIISSSHLLEHLTREEGYNFLKECYRIMKPGGIIRISVPDTKKITEDYVEGRIREHRFINTGVADADDDAGAYYNLLLAGHKTLYDSDSLRSLLSKVGFKNIEESTPFTSRSETVVKQTISCHPTISCILEATR